MLLHIFLLLVVLSLLIWGVQYLPFPPVPKQIICAVLIIGAALALLQQVGWVPWLNSPAR